MDYPPVSSIKSFFSMVVGICKACLLYVVQIIIIVNLKVRTCLFGNLKYFLFVHNILKYVLKIIFIYCVFFNYSLYLFNYFLKLLSENK